MSSSVWQPVWAMLSIVSFWIAAAVSYRGVTQQDWSPTAFYLPMIAVLLAAMTAFGVLHYLTRRRITND